jgi:predicted GNAT family acetyltransferase
MAGTCPGRAGLCQGARAVKLASALQRKDFAVEGIEIVRLDQGRVGEYHAHIPGSSEVARLTWVLRDTPAGPVRVAEHTLVPRAFEGRGIAARLVDALIADAREAGFRVEPQCSYVAAQFRRHPDWAPLHA